jgi:chloramphenicol 3-O-phosphotransferase
VTTGPLILLTGPPGAGKTTVSKLLATSFAGRACVLESDWWWTTIVPRRIDPWLPEALQQNRTVVRSYMGSAAVMAAGGYPTIVEGVLGPWMFDIVREETEPRGLDVHYAVLRPALDETLRRAMGRGGEERVTGHAALTDEGPIRQLWHEFADLGAHESHAVDTTKLRVEESAHLLRQRIQSGQLRLTAFG